jgi:hypothetical protein
LYRERSRGKSLNASAGFPLAENHSGVAVSGAAGVVQLPSKALQRRRGIGHTDKEGENVSR